MIATRRSPGTSSRSRSSRLPARSVDRTDSPVTLPPGRARLATSPLPTGSPATENTIGIVAVACFAATISGVPEVTIISTLRRANSAAISAARSLRPSIQRYSITTVRPSIQETSRSRSTKAAIRLASAAGVPWPMYPMTGSLPGCCARATSGHPAAAPPSSVMNERRFIIRSPRRPQPCLCDFRVPKNRCSKLEDVTDVLTEGGRLDPFSPRHVRHFAQSDLLNLVGEPQALRFIRCAHPVGDEPFELRNIRPPIPGIRARARYAEVNGRIDHVSRLIPCKKQVPAALLGRLLAFAYSEVRRPIHCPEYDLEADRLQSLTRDERCRAEERDIGDLDHHDWPAIVPGFLHELARSREVMLHDRLSPNPSRIRAATGKY